MLRTVTHFCGISITPVKKAVYHMHVEHTQEKMPKVLLCSLIEKAGTVYLLALKHVAFYVHIC